MHPPLSIRNQFCANEACPFYSKVLEGNVLIHSQKQGRVKCKECGKTWVAHRNEWTYGLRTPLEKVDLATAMMKQGFSIRKIAEEVGVSPSTVQGWRKKIKKKSSV